MSAKEIKLIQNRCVLWSHVLVVSEVDRPVEEMGEKATTESQACPKPCQLLMLFQGEGLNTGKMQVVKVVRERREVQKMRPSQVSGYGTPGTQLLHIFECIYVLYKPGAKPSATK